MLSQFPRHSCRQLVTWFWKTFPKNKIKMLLCKFQVEQNSLKIIFKRPLLDYGIFTAAKWTKNLTFFQRLRFFGQFSKIPTFNHDRSVYWRSNKETCYVIFAKTLQNLWMIYKRFDILAVFQQFLLLAYQLPFYKILWHGVTLSFYIGLANHKLCYNPSIYIIWLTNE